LRLSATSLSLLGTGTGLIILGILFGNMALLYLGSTPVIFLVLVLMVGEVGEVTIVPVSGAMDVVVGEEVELQREVTIRGGVGVVTVREELPEHFRLVTGSNMRLAFKGSEDLHLSLNYRVECARRGVYHFDKLGYQVRHVLGLLEPKTGSLPINQFVTVRPHLAAIRKARVRRQASLLPDPAESQIRMGVDTSEFREMRRYVFGDPYRKINWKATSRALTASGLPPIVNEYEKEGKRVIYIFLNCGRCMASGSSLENGFEYGVQATLGLTQFYVDGQGMVGFSLYNEDMPFVSRTSTSSALKEIYEAKGPRVMVDLMSGTHLESSEGTSNGAEVLAEARRLSVYPDSGRRQLLKIRMMLQEAEPGASTYNLTQSFQLALGNLRSTRPLLIFVTSIQPATAAKMREDLIQVQRRLGRTRDGRKGLMVLNISCFRLSSKSMEDDLAARIAKTQEARLLEESFGDFADVVDWDPREGSLVEALSAGDLS